MPPKEEVGHGRRPFLWNWKINGLQFLEKEVKKERQNEGKGMMSIMNILS